MATGSVGHNALIQQGYDYSPAELAELSWGLRFTPFVCMLAAVVGLTTRQPAIHFGLAVLGILPFWFPAGHPIDWLYNRAIRRLWNGVALPPNPLPRRLACLIGGSMNLAIGFAFLAGNLPVAYALGAVLVVLQVVVITTHFCVASWMYEGALRALGRFVPLVAVAEVRELLGAGAELIDVREPDEFARGHLRGARNVPLDRVVETLAREPSRPLVFYCVSGLRSQRAVQLLRRQGRESLYNLGAMSRFEAP